MGQTNGADDMSEHEPVRSVHVVNGVATSVSKDGNVGLLKFYDAAGQEFALTFPLLAGTGVIMNMVLQLAAQVRIRFPDVFFPIYPQTVDVGQHDGIRNCAIITFDGAASFVIKDIDALPLADGIRMNVLNRKTPAQRARMVGPKIILPGR